MNGTNTVNTTLFQKIFLLTTWNAGNERDHTNIISEVVFLSLEINKIKWQGQECKGKFRILVILLVMYNVNMVVISYSAYDSLFKLINKKIFLPLSKLELSKEHKYLRRKFYFCVLPIQNLYYINLLKLLCDMPKLVPSECPAVLVK